MNLFLNKPEKRQLISDMLIPILSCLVKFAKYIS